MDTKELNGMTDDDMPDKNCITLPNGDCVGTNCMHDAPKKEMETDHPLLQKKELTLKDYKNLRRMYFTVRRATVSECGHKYDDMNQPRTNCQFCWFAFLNSHGDMVKIADEVFRQENGPKLLAKLKGDKFVKQFKRFMSTVAQWKIEADKMKEQNGEGNGSNEGGLVQEFESVGRETEQRTEDNNIIS